jgi:hypothetical protein
MSGRNAKEIAAELAKMKANSRYAARSAGQGTATPAQKPVRGRKPAPKPVGLLEGDGSRHSEPEPEPAPAPEPSSIKTIRAEALQFHVRTAELQSLIDCFQDEDAFEDTLKGINALISTAKAAEEKRRAERDAEVAAAKAVVTGIQAKEGEIALLKEKLALASKYAAKAKLEVLERAIAAREAWIAAARSDKTVAALLKRDRTAVAEQAGLLEKQAADKIAAAKRLVDDQIDHHASVLAAILDGRTVFETREGEEMHLVPFTVLAASGRYKIVSKMDLTGPEKAELYDSATEDAIRQLLGAAGLREEYTLLDGQKVRIDLPVRRLVAAVTALRFYSQRQKARPKLADAWGACAKARKLAGAAEKDAKVTSVIRYHTRGRGGLSDSMGAAMQRALGLRAAGRSTDRGQPRAGKDIPDVDN